jgi:serine/threonine protein kinase
VTLQLQSAISPIPGYELQERIGTGGYGEVWRSTAPGGLLKAVKFVFGYMDDERATRELKALQRIREVRHPFLLSLERIEVVDGQLVIVTELADGSLKDRFVQCRQQGLPGIPRDELLEHLRDAAAALDFMSERHSLQHLDVKPENLLLVGGRVKVADFGLVKDLIDGSISLMGSMTPIYAPPEVFDGRPSRASDQYSLAIVYQEMLTGVLPFPGKTLAQLAAQHLSSRPRLAALPVADHAAMSQALAKDPAARHANCHALVEALLSAGKSASQSAPLESAAGSARAFAKSETKTNGKAPTQAAPAMPPSRPSSSAVVPNSESPGTSTPVYKTVVLGSDPAAIESRPALGHATGDWAADDAAEAPDVGPAAEAPADADDLPTSVTWLPPVENDRADSALRPVLFIGLGGLAGRALQQLRGRLAERFGDLNEMPAIQLLLIDTDVRALTQASGGPAERSLATSQTLALPLRKTLDYRTDSRKLLRWLSRRWLYNIPRSLQTEGLRPLGRLALVDHADQVLKRLRAQLLAITSADARAASALHADVPVEGPPRVFLVSSISGGAGSGMVLDVAYAVRHVAGELGLSVDDLCGLLAHVTGRDLDAQALAVANTHSFLQELHHYSHPLGGYPGDAACGLPPCEPGVPPFSHTYVLPLGDDLVEGDFDAAAATLAEYLYRASVTPAAALLDACRQPGNTASTAVTGEPRNPGVRSFGLCPLGVSPGNLGQTTDALCRQVVDGWRGADATGIDARAAKHSDEQGLRLEATARTIRALLAKGLGGDADAYIRRAVVGYLAAAASREASDTAGAGPLAGMNKALGLLDEADSARPSLGSVERGLPKMLQELAVARIDGLRTWLLERVADPDAGLAAAGRAADWFVQHFRMIEKRASEQRGKLTEELKDLERGLQAAAPPERSRARAWLGLGSAVRPGSEQEQWMTRYAHARLEAIAWQGVSGHARGCASHVGAIAAQLKDLGRDLALVAAQFSTDTSIEKPGAGDRKQFVPEVEPDEDARASLAAMLRKQMTDLTARIDADLRREFLGIDGCLTDILCRRVDLRGTLPARLRAAARAVVLDALRQIDVADVLFPALRGDVPPDEPGEPLRGALRRATPDWLDTGGAARLLLFLPEGTSVDRLQSLLEREAGARATVARDVGGDLLLGCEVAGLSLPRIAATLVADRPDCREAAARLHARIDVAWRKAQAWR